MQFDLTCVSFPFFKSTLPQPVQICVWACTASGRWCDQYWLPAVSQPVLLGRPDTPQPTGTSWTPLCSGQSLGTGLEEGSDLSVRTQENTTAHWGQCRVTTHERQKHLSRTISAKGKNVHQIHSHTKKKGACILLISPCEWAAWIFQGECNPLGNKKKWISLSQSLLTLMHSGVHGWIN